MIGITETKVDGTIFDADICIVGYSIIQYDRDRRGGGVACYIKNDICFNTKNILSNKIEVIFLHLVFLKTIPYLLEQFIDLQK